MNNRIHQDELEALRSIFCGPDEFELLSSSVKEQVCLIRSRTDFGTQFQLTWTTNDDYPSTPPQVALQVPCLTRSVLEILESALRAEARKLIGEPMMLSLILWLKEELKKLTEANQECDDGNVVEDFQTVIVELDHMRDRTTYIKIIRQWCRELSLRGLLLFHKRNIWLLVNGSSADIRKYLKLHRTSYVDVDSSGRSCKERLMTVLGYEKGHKMQAIGEGELVVEDFGDREHEHSRWTAFLSSNHLSEIHDKWLKVDKPRV